MSFLIFGAPSYSLGGRLCATILAAAVTAALVHAGPPGEGAPLSLDEALQLAASQSPQLAAQRYGVTAAERAIVPARELPDPKLFFGVDNLPVNGPDAWSLTQDFMTMRKIGVMQDFPNARKRELKGQFAQYTAAREAAMLGDTRAALRRDVATAWLQRYFAERMSAVVGEQIAEAELQQEAMRAGVRANRTPPADLLMVGASLQSLLDRNAQFQKDSARAKAMLSRWLGDAADRPLAPLASMQPSVDQSDLRAHIEQHPHVQSLERQVDVAQTEARLAQAATKPDWGVELSYAQRGPSYSNMVSVQVAVELPIFQSRRKNPDIASKMAQAEQARELREDAIRQHVAEARVAWSDWQAAESRLKRFDQTLLPLASERVKTALAAYRGGKGELAAVLSARRDEIDLRMQQLQLQSDQALAYAQLLYFSHGEGGK